jgi:hypothetical protein
VSNYADSSIAMRFMRDVPCFTVLDQQIDYASVGLNNEQFSGLVVVAKEFTDLVLFPCYSLRLL